MVKIGLVSIVVLVLCIGAFAGEKQEIKIAVAASAAEDTSEISRLAGRAPYYLIFDINGKLLEVTPNKFRDARGGAGIAVANFLADKQVTAVIAGEFGPNMIDALKKRGVKYFQMTGGAKKAVEELVVSGQLKK